MWRGEVRRSTFDRAAGQPPGEGRRLAAARARTRSPTTSPPPIMSEVEEYAQPGDEEAARARAPRGQDAVAGFAARAHAGPAAAAGARSRRRRPRRPACSATSAGCSRWRDAASARCTPRCGSAPASPGSACRSRPGRATETRRRSPASGRRSSGTSMSSPPPARPGTPRPGPSSPARRASCGGACSTCSPPARPRPLRRSRAWPRAAGWPLPRRVAAVALTPLAGSSPARCRPTCSPT